jgi:predicted RNase H-like nuclease (RuvC/YqgF family)
MREATRSTADAAAVSIDSVQQVVKSLQEEIKILRQENEELKAGLETKENEVKKQIDEINDLKLASTEHQDFNNQSLQLHAQIQGLKKAVAEKNATIEQMEEIHTNEMEELRLQLQAEIDALKESFNQEKQNLITVTDKQIKQMRDKVNDIAQSQSDSESDMEEKKR